MRSCCLIELIDLLIYIPSLFLRIASYIRQHFGGMRDNVVQEEVEGMRNILITQD